MGLDSHLDIPVLFEQRGELDVFVSEDVVLERPGDPLVDLILDKDLGGHVEHLVDLLERELLGLADKEEGGGKGNEVGARVEAYLSGHSWPHITVLYNSPKVPAPPSLYSWKGSYESEEDPETKTKAKNVR